MTFVALIALLPPNFTLFSLCKDYDHQHHLLATMNAHTWRFFRAGGFDQVRLQSGADLAALDQLDQKLWVALAVPATGLEFDSRTLSLIDTDKDGRIRPPELIAAAKWVCEWLKNS